MGIEQNNARQVIAEKWNISLMQSTKELSFNENDNIIYQTLTFPLVGIWTGFGILTNDSTEIYKKLLLKSSALSLLPYLI